MNSQRSHGHTASGAQMEALLFSLGSKEVFGISVFKVREVNEARPVTRMPNPPPGMVGTISLRGTILPVIDLAQCIGMPSDAPKTKLLITEFSGHSQAFLVHNVDRIVRIDWSRVKAPDALPGSAHQFVNAITELDDGTLVAILDVEHIMGSLLGEETAPSNGIPEVPEHLRKAVFYADDSALARRKIAEVLDALQLPRSHAKDGAAAWESLSQMADAARKHSADLSETLGLIMVDAEMPEMDGYSLTRRIKQDPRFSGIPVVMHSSLSSEANRRIGQEAGVDAYVAKFNAPELASTIYRQLVGVHSG